MKTSLRKILISMSAFLAMVFTFSAEAAQTFIAQDTNGVEKYVYRANEPIMFIAKGFNAALGPFGFDLDTRCKVTIDSYEDGGRYYLRYTNPPSNAGCPDLTFYNVPYSYATPGAYIVTLNYAASTVRPTNKTVSKTITIVNDTVVKPNYDWLPSVIGMTLE